MTTKWTYVDVHLQSSDQYESQIQPSQIYCQVYGPAELYSLLFFHQGCKSQRTISILLPQNFTTETYPVQSILKAKLITLLCLK